MKNFVYLMTVTDNEPNEYSNEKVFKSTYADEVLAFHFMVHDIAEQFEKGRIKNMDGLAPNMTVYKNGDIEWKIERIKYVSDIV